MSSSVYKTLNLKWNVFHNVSLITGFTYGIHTQQIHLAAYVKQIFGSLQQIRSRHQYNVYYRAVGNELQKQSIIQNRSLFNIFLRTASFESLKTKWAALFGFKYSTSYSESQFRNLIYGLNIAYHSRPTPGAIKVALQQICQISSNKVNVYEYWKDRFVMTFFSEDWLFRNGSVLLFNDTVISSTSNTITSALLTGYADNSLVGYTIITVSSGTLNIRVIQSNVQATGEATITANWAVNPVFGEAITVSILGSTRNSLSGLRPDNVFYTAFGLTNYGFQVWISVDDYLNVVNVISDIVKKIKQAYTRFAIAYILHTTNPGSLVAAFLNPAKNPRYIAVGSGNPAWDPFNPQKTGTETSLYAELDRSVTLLNYLNPDESPSSVPTKFLEVTGFFKPGVATSDRIMEMGIYAEDGTTLLYYSANVAIKKSADDALIWKVRIQYASL